MTQEILSKFLEAKFDEHKPFKKTSSSSGLIITISRSKGCHATPIAEKLVKKLNSSKHPVFKTPKFKLLSKEILDESARKLQIHPGNLERLIESEEKSLFEEILLSLSGENYPSDLKIRNSIRDVIKSAASQGNVVVLGRGGVAITKKIPNTIHIKLDAPLKWRVKQLSIGYNWSEKKALSHILKIDKMRKALRDFYFGKPKGDEIFDLIINLSRLTPKEVVKTLHTLISARQKHLKNP